MKIDWKQVVHMAPMILAFTPFAPFVPFIVEGITAAEQIKGATGEEKLAHAVEIARQGIAATNVGVGHELISPALSDAAIQTSISAVVNSIKLVESVRAAAGQPDTADTPQTREVSGGAVVIGFDKHAAAGSASGASGAAGVTSGAQSAPSDG